MKLITKRNGDKQEYNFEKIEKAIRAAFSAANRGYTDEEKIIQLVLDVSKNTVNQLFTKGEVTVELIQDAVEKTLMACGQYDIAKSYILYRADHAEEREMRKRIQYMKDYQLNGENASTSSATDPNANMNIKNVANMEAEVYKPTNRKTQRIMTCDAIEKLYGKELSKQYLIDLEGHLIYTHDEASSPVIKNYCEAVSLYPLLKGTGSLDGTSTQAPKHLHSFCGQLINATFLLASQCKGAVAFGEFFNFLDFFIVKDYGEDYDLNEKELADNPNIIKNPKTIGQKIEQAFQQIVFNWNQPAGNRGSQSPFTNISYYDKNYWHAMFDEFVFPDGSKPIWRRVDYLQRKFIHWFNDCRSKTLLTFPVETMALLTDGKDVIDKEYKDLTTEMYSKGHSFFTYISDRADSLASCCFTPETKVLWKSSTQGVRCTTFKELFEAKREFHKGNLRIFHNGFWIKGKPIRTLNTNFYKITTANRKTFYMTNDHINVTIDGEKKASELKVGDYLMFNTQVLQAVPDVDECLTYEQGFAVGAFLGNGSFGDRFPNGTIYDINYSQNCEKYQKCMDIVNVANKQLGGESSCNISSVHNNVFPVRISSKLLVAFIQKWTNWKEGTRAYNKELNLDCLLQSVEFRKGILDGWYNTDGGNSNRCYTTSEKLKDCMEILITSLGMNSIIDCHDRTDEKTIIREYKYSRNYPLWCIRWYESCNKIEMPNVYKWKNNSQFFKVVEIERVGEDHGEDYSYCIECIDKENPYFTLPSGLITHNCRLKNEIKTKEFTFTNGLTGVQTGSCNVITINLSRLVQKSVKERNNLESAFKDVELALAEIVERIHKYHIAYKTMLYEWEDNGMFTASKAGYISMSKLYSTIGLNGINEASEFLGIKCSNNKDYIAFCQLITGTISELNKKNSSKKFLFNTEFVPKRSGDVKPLLIDSKLLNLGQRGASREIVQRERLNKVAV